MSAVSELSETGDGSFLRCCLYLHRFFRRIPAPAPWRVPPQICSAASPMPHGLTINNFKVIIR